MRQPTQSPFGAARAGPMSHGESEILNALAEPLGRGPRVRPRLPPIFRAHPLGALAGTLLGPIVRARPPGSMSACVGKLFYPLKFTFWMPE